MLELNEIRKEYVTESNTTIALKGVSIKFRQNEFVSILGPSGCGKTTLLNIIGGLDRYTSGDLIINGKSTKEYSDKDWDVYRNHTIGFVFQTYNLIMHLNVEENVELALTLSGINESERKARTKEVLERVGLADKAKARPNQLSGGQMQRVAIARALINNPDILLADEPTGALDSETSVQVMDLLKEIAKDKLVIMVTHNPELAEEYSTRIIKIKDGVLIGDTNPVQEELPIVEDKTNLKKKSMSLFTALKLSGKNLKTKFTRTLLVALAGSIGIIGIALILSMSTGFQKYVDDIEEKALAEYPLSIEKLSTDMSVLTEIMERSLNAEKYDDGKIHVNNIMTDILKMASENTDSNDLKSFKVYLDNNEEIKEHVIDIKYSYDSKFYVYTNQPDDLGYYNHDLIYPSPIDSLGMLGWSELLNDQDLLNKKYDLKAGTWPTKSDEIMIILDENEQISDVLLYMLGLRTITEITEMIAGNEVDVQETYTYDELLDQTFKFITKSDLFYKENETDTLYKIANYKSANYALIDEKGHNLKVTAVAQAKSKTDTASIIGGIAYTSALKAAVIDINDNAEVTKEQLANPEVSILTGATFDPDISGTENTYKFMLTKLGYVELDNPDRIMIYPKSFDDKAAIIDIINQYNDSVPKEQKIKYTDEVAILISSVEEILNAVTYVLIAFVSVSLVVSSIMIGVITYISVLERTKEIGVLRSIGASKRDIRRVFNAETLIIGLSSGLLGDGLAALLLIPINLIIKHFTDIPRMGIFPWQGVVALILISTALTLIAGLIPSGIAAKRDPVVALRSE